MTYKKGTETRSHSERDPRVEARIPEDWYEKLTELRARGYTVREVIVAGIKAILANQKIDR